MTDGIDKRRAPRRPFSQGYSTSITLCPRRPLGALPLYGFYVSHFHFIFVCLMVYISFFIPWPKIFVLFLFGVCRANTSKYCTVANCLRMTNIQVKYLCTSCDDHSAGNSGTNWRFSQRRNRMAYGLCNESFSRQHTTHVGSLQDCVGLPCLLMPITSLHVPQMRADLYTNGDYVLHMDSDVIVFEDVTYRHIFHLHKPVLPYRRYRTDAGFEGTALLYYM